MTAPVAELYKSYLKALLDREAGLFVGAGLSAPTGFVDWRGLLRETAEDLGLDVDQETDLIAVAQYHVNKHGGRSKLNQVLIDEFTKAATLTENHRLIAELPLYTIWTTNYDNLLEDAFRQANKRADVKSDREQLALTLPKRDVTIYKMHGDVSRPSEAVLTREDYETYQEKRGGFSLKLQGDLISKTFLFLGFSFTDPNIEYVLSRIRALVGQSNRRHYCIMRNPKPPAGSRGKAKARYEYERTKLGHRIADLRRYGIAAVLVDDYKEITEVLRELHRRAHQRSVFVSGSASEFTPFDRDRLERLGHAIGGETIRRGYNLVSGLGLGLGSSVMVGALEALYGSPQHHTDERITLRPFPQTAKHLWRRYREEMIEKAGAAIFLAGNKLVRGRPEVSPGVLEEFEIASSQGRYPIPVGATGHAAQRIWTQVNRSPGKYFASHARSLAPALAKLNSSRATNEELVVAIFGILEKVVPPPP